MFNLSESALYEWVEAGSELLISIVFLIGACVRYKDLKELGKTSDAFSPLLTTKLSVFYMLILLHVGHTAINVINSNHVTYLNYASLFTEVVYILVLIFATRLLVKEHRARLSEVWYCHKILYALNVLFTGAIMYYFYYDMVSKTSIVDSRFRLLSAFSSTLRR